MSPSSPVSVGTFPSNRTLLVGTGQILRVLVTVKPILEDPFIVAMPVSIGVKYSTGKTIGKKEFKKTAGFGEVNIYKGPHEKPELCWRIELAIT